MTKISLFWFEKLNHVIPTHFVTADIDEMPEEVRKYKDQLDGRSMLVKKAKVIPLEAIVRGYLTGMPCLLHSFHRVIDYSLRFWMGGIQEVWDCSWHPSAGRISRVPEAPPASVYAVYQSRTG